ncbi:MAG: class I SAM-dependent methyltransferase [Actinomycetota bacterium]|nr:class I SAM-dependent methyltransferase [Actinomycetota bacterium]
MSELAPDGSPVLLYARLPPLGEAELIHEAVPAGSQILELGAGAGRITHELIALGHEVVAVDNSAEMLAFIRGAETVLGDMKTLDLGRRFPVVVLASNFINDPESQSRRTFLECCARHVLPDGQVLLQGFPRDWVPSSDWSEHGAVRLRLRSWEQKDGLIRGEMEYFVDGEKLHHAFESKLLTEEELDADLHAAGLRRRRALDAGGAWREAVLSDS